MKTLRSVALEVVRALRAAGHEAFFAGGCVRDTLLGRTPKDFDVAASAHPEDVERLFQRTVTVGKAFGVVRVRMHDHEIEVATFRAEGPYHDGRRPSSVRFTTAREDAERRDFTVNALFYDPVRRKVLDFVNGRADLRRGLLRAVGDPAKRFEEDRLRLLRCIRFAAQLGFRIETGTWRAITRMSGDPCLREAVSAERVRDELSKLLQAPHAAAGLRLLNRSGLMKWALPEIEAMCGVAQPRAFHPEGDVFVHTLKVIANLRRPGLRLVWAALLHDVGKPPTFEKSCVRGCRRIRFPEHARVGVAMAEDILKRLRFSTADREAIVAMVANHMTFKDVKAMRLATVKRLLARPTFDDELLLHRADCLASHGGLSNVRFLKRRQRELSAEEIRPPRLIGGRDLIAAGLDPGPLFGEILAAVEEAQLEGRIRTRVQAFQLAREMARKRGRPEDLGNG